MGVVVPSFLARAFLSGLNVKSSAVCNSFCNTMYESIAIICTFLKDIIREDGRVMKLSCIECHKEYSIDSLRYACDCGNMLDVKHDFNTIDSDYLKQIFNGRLADRVSPFASGVWRYKELIFPELENDHIVTKYEGNTGIYNTEKISKYTGNRCTWVKAQSENPSGSFKDNGMTVAVSHG